jgi:outer membrane protein
MNMKMIKRAAVGALAAFVLSYGVVTTTTTPVVQAAPANSGATIGIIDTALIKTSAQEFKKAQDAIAAEEQNLQKEFDEKSAGLSEAEKKQLFAQYQQRLQLKARDVLMKAEEKAMAAVKEVATAQGLTVVLDKDSVFYGGKDITQEVIQKLSK